MSGIFVTGTDTGVGKTLIATGFLRAFSTAGFSTVGMKPVAAGLTLHASQWMNADVIALQQESSIEAPVEWVNPYALKQGIAPHIAAARDGVKLESAPILDAYRRLAALAQVVVVEGVGGFRVPLAPSFDSAQLAAAMGLPVVLVVGMRLGCLNHALLTADAVRAAGLTLAGWVANVIDPGMNALRENIAALDERLGTIRLATIPYFGQSGASAKQVAGHFLLPSLSHIVKEPR